MLTSAEFEHLTPNEMSGSCFYCSSEEPLLHSCLVQELLLPFCEFILLDCLELLSLAQSSFIPFGSLNRT